MATVYSYTGDKDITRNGQKCVPWIEAARGGIYVFSIGENLLNMYVDQHDPLSDFSEEELMFMGNKCR